MTFKMKSTWDFWSLLLDCFSLFIEGFKRSGNLVSKLNISISKILEFSSKIVYVFFSKNTDKLVLWYENITISFGDLNKLGRGVGMFLYAVLGFIFSKKRFFCNVNDVIFTFFEH